jgi:HrpA-like RNA helicase
MDDSRDHEIQSRNDADITSNSEDIDDDRHFDVKGGADAYKSNSNDDQDFDELPVTAYKNEIMECILHNQIVICISETGR